jgi:hypothetical protein
MAAKKPHHTLADYMVIGLSPLLIMALIGSLVFFLLAILYKGTYAGRMEWTLFFFVFGAVLVCRISMMGEIANRAGLYRLILGLFTWMALQAYVEYPPNSPLAPWRWALNLGFIVLIWWCAQRLTWDCTYIDDTIDASGKGVLESAGLDESAPSDKAEEDPDSESAEAPKEAKKAPESTGFFAWWDRYQRYSEDQKRRPHTPGVWVVYFSLAALPLFGLGQALIPANQLEQRRYTFWLLVIYVASGLGLLLTTCFLGLRRYLRQRQVQMPKAITGMWLTVGAILIGALLVLGAVLPRPNSEYPLVDFGSATSKERDATRYATRSKDAGKGNERSSGGSEKPGEKTAGKSGNQPGDKGQPGDKAGDKSGGSGGQKGKGNSSQGKGNDKSSGSRSRDSDGGKDGEKSDGQKDEGSDSKGASESGSSRAPSDDPVSKALSSISNVSPVLQKVVLGIVIAVIAFFVLMAVLRFLANFTNWAASLLQALRAWWESPFGWLNREPSAETSADTAEETAPSGPPPFSLFVNPFLDGRAQRLPPAELIRYSFQALEAWAHERARGRQPEETPLEFVHRVCDEFPPLEADVTALAGLYARAAYAAGTIPANYRSVLQEYWQRLEAMVEQPQSV